MILLVLSEDVSDKQLSVIGMAIQLVNVILLYVK